MAQLVRDEPSEAQKVSFLESLLGTLLADDALVQQAKVNTPKQFVESPDFDDAVTGAVADNQGAHNKMADYFFTNAPGRTQLVGDIARCPRVGTPGPGGG